MLNCKLVLISILLISITSFSQTTYLSGGYGVSGIDFDQPEIQFNLECSFNKNDNFSNLYRWRYCYGDYSGLIFEYNTRAYFSTDLKEDNSKWFWQAKLGYYLLKGKTFDIGSVYLSDPINGDYLNSTVLTDTYHFNFNYGLALGYKAIVFNRLSAEIFLGYAGFLEPNFKMIDESYKNLRMSDWKSGIASPIEVRWSLGFFIN
jgi:hypothetical protein